MIEDVEKEPYPGYWNDVAAAQEVFVPRDPVDEVTDIATLIAVHQAEQYTSVATLWRRAMADAGAHVVASSVVDRSVRLELAAALRVTEYAAGDLLARSIALTQRYPVVLDALHAARVTDQHVRFLVDALDAATPEVAAGLIERALALAEDLPAGTFRQVLRRLIETKEAATLSERHAKAVADRRVRVDDSTDGMAYLTAYLPAVEAHAIVDRLTRMGSVITGRHAAHDDVDGGLRTLDQVRADLLCDLLIDGSCTEHPATARGIRSTVVVTVPVLSLLDDGHAATHPATIEGIGPIPIEKARELCGGSAQWMRVLTHPESGMVLSVGRTRYDPPPELRRLVRWRAERCMAPGCTVPASRCEIDHNQAWQDGGATALDNHCPLCIGHHHVKHQGGWGLRQLPDSGGVIEWTSPYGRRYLVEPERRVPVFRTEPTTPHESAPAPF